ncbi:hypothetical protein [Salinibaculum rarum]|uniref:hypothetical protein n=1 Tax=Salinibaculum rarum TaxID=3058903 RepID=UPI00265F5EC6|nr:hypothetical protein [Salinibaculum sp. KK48]
MQPGNAAALYSHLESYCDPTHATHTITVNGTDHDVYHTQLTTYQIDAIADLIAETAQDADFNLPEDTLFDFSDIVETAINNSSFGAPTHDKHLYPRDSLVDPITLSSQATKLEQLRDDDQISVSVESIGDLTAKLLTLYNIDRFQQRRLSAEKDAKQNLRENGAEFEVSKRETAEAITAMAGVIADAHDPAVFELPSPDPITVTELWWMIEETGFEPSHEWVYALYIDHKRPLHHAPDDAMMHEMMTGVSNLMMPKRHRDTSEKWESNAEPDLEDVTDDHGYVTLDS